MTEGYQPPTSRASSQRRSGHHHAAQVPAPGGSGPVQELPVTGAGLVGAVPIGRPAPAVRIRHRPAPVGDGWPAGSALGWQPPRRRRRHATTSAASTAKDAIRNAANEAEAKAARPVRRSGRTGRQPRRARLTLSHINVYSVFKFSCVLAIALFFVWLIAVGVLYGILDVSGVFSKINDTVHTISGDGKTNDVVTGSLVFGGAIIIGVVNIVLFIALSTIGAMVYNLCADLVGGAEITLSERE